MDCMKDGFVKDLLLEGRYKTISPLNHGSFGMVFLAKDLKRNELVAIKCLAKPSSVASPDPNNPTDHLLELLCHDRLGHHPNVVNLLHAFETDSHMFLVLEYCPQGDLYEAIRMGRGPLQTEHVRSFMRQLIDAVAFMHAKGLYHRDIKPENIFLAADGAMKLGDFGLSTTEIWTSEAGVGSDRYMAPEQYDPGEAGYSPAQADVWAIGICLLNLLFSRNPFVTPTESDVLFADFVRDRQSLFDVFPALSQDTFDVLSPSLALDPAKRSLNAMREALDRVVSFTTDDEVSDDDFCTDAGRPRHGVPAATTASRAPLRTPSIQSPPVEQGGAFPWAKALHLTSPVQPSTRQLSAIPDTESVTMPDVQPASFASGIDSALGASIQSLQLREPKPRTAPTITSTTVQPVPVPQPAKPATASLYATDNVSKSWSDLWDEEAEELESETEDHDASRRAYSNLNWSSDAVNEADTEDADATLQPSETVKTLSRAAGTPRKLMTLRPTASTSDLSSPSTPSPKSPAYSPPARRGLVDKWAALGNRRRAVNAAVVAANSLPARADSDKTASPVKAAKPSTYFGGTTWRKGFGLKAFTGNVGFRRGNVAAADEPATAGIYGTPGGARISNGSLTDLPTTPGSVGLGLQEDARGARSTGRVKVSGRRAADLDDWRKDQRLSSPRFARNLQGTQNNGQRRKRRTTTKQGEVPVALPNERDRRDDVEWVGDYDLQL